MQLITSHARAPSHPSRGKLLPADLDRNSSAAQAIVLPERRRSVALSLILADARLGAKEYVDRWVAGRGAE